jgi:hypothetical protein
VTFPGFHLSQLLTETQKALSYINQLALLHHSSSSKHNKQLSPQQHPTTKHVFLATDKRRRTAIASSSTTFPINSAIAHRSRLRTSPQLTNNSLIHYQPFPKRRALQALQAP